MFGNKSKLQIARQAWNTKEMVAKYDDDRLKIVSHAILAPNPHNVQPWKIHIEKQNEVLLYIDSEHILPMSDPKTRQIHMGQGTFLEVFSIAAKEYGYQAEIELFPKGIDSLEHIGKSPVAKITLNKASPQKDELFDQIYSRITNRKPYQGPPLTTAEINQLKTSYDAKNYPVIFITDPQKISRIADLMTEAMKIETYTNRVHGETVKMIRFNDDEVVKYRDGFNFENLGNTGFQKFFVELISPRKKAFGDSLRKNTVKSIGRMAHTSKAIGLILSKENGGKDHVEIGRAYARVNLTSTKLGLSMHPMMQITQEYEELVDLRKKFQEELELTDMIPQMVFRVGHAKATPHSARRELESFLF